MDDDLYPRHLTWELAATMASARVVNVVGPRQVGKTVLVRDLYAHGRFVTLDDETMLAALDADPYGSLQSLAAEAGDAPVIIDEAQRSKRMVLALKRIVDERRRPGQFLLTGSSDIFTAADVVDSLAGRVQTLTLFPLSLAEVHRAGPVRLLDWAGSSDAPHLTDLPRPPPTGREDVIDLLLRGGYPELRRTAPRRRTQSYRNYVRSVVDRDVADVKKIRMPDKLRIVVDQMAARTAQELNVFKMSGDLGIERPTLESYLDVLTRLSLVRRLGAWASGEVRREIRHPKMHFVDTGLAAALRSLGPRSFAPDADPAALGGLLETLVFMEIQKSLPFQSEGWDLFHWRGDSGREVDILAQCDRALVAMEVKASMTVGREDFRHLHWFRTEGPGRNRRTTGIVFYMGERALPFGERSFALPVSVLWAFPMPDRAP